MSKSNTRGQIRYTTRLTPSTRHLVSGREGLDLRRQWVVPFWSQTRAERLPLILWNLLNGETSESKEKTGRPYYDRWDGRSISPHFVWSIIYSYTKHLTFRDIFALGRTDRDWGRDCPVRPPRRVSSGDYLRGEGTAVEVEGITPPPLYPLSIRPELRLTDPSYPTTTPYLCIPRSRVFRKVYVVKWTKRVIGFLL